MGNNLSNCDCKSSLEVI
jgi:hypothetical protein